MLEDEGIEHTVLCHTEEQKQQFIEHGLVKAERLIATGNPRGLAYNRNYALDMMEQGEWAMFLVDDMKSVTELNNYDRASSPLPIKTDNQSIYAKRFRTPVTMQHFMKRAEQLSVTCGRNNCYLGGWAGINNPLYRTHKYKTNILADGRAWIVRKTNLRFDENANLIDDLCWTALNIKHYGIVIVDQWILPDCRRYTKGAFGSIEQRMEQKKIEAAYLVKTYPELITFKEKVGWESGSHVVLKQSRKKPKLIN